MRIWHQKLLPHLCRQHLLACWREGLVVYSIITNNKNGYRNHPAVLEYRNAPRALHEHLRAIQKEMIKRGYHPKPLPPLKLKRGRSVIRPWQTLAEQRRILNSKPCKCILPILT